VRTTDYKMRELARIERLASRVATAATTVPAMRTVKASGRFPGSFCEVRARPGSPRTTRTLHIAAIAIFRLVSISVAFLRCCNRFVSLRGRSSLAYLRPRSRRVRARGADIAIQPRQGSTQSIA
jgi:hypothetical protein